MNKRIFGGLAAAVMLAGGLAFGSAGTASAEQSDTVNHPVCAGVIVDIKPGAPTPIDGIVFVKAGNTHTDVGFHKAGYVATSPNNSAVSHVDVCPASSREPLIVFGEFVDGAFVCDTTVVQTRTKTTTTFTPTMSGFTEAVTVTQDPRTREATEAEKSACAITPPPVDKPLPPTPAGKTPTQATPAGQTPAQADVVAALPPTQVGSSGATPQVVVPAQGLPSTGIDGTGVTALVALMMTSLGGAALFVSRRRNVMT